MNGRSLSHHLWVEQIRFVGFNWADGGFGLSEGMAAQMSLPLIGALCNGQSFTGSIVASKLSHMRVEGKVIPKWL